jgi:hypothetical protein
MPKKNDSMAGEANEFEINEIKRVFFFFYNMFSSDSGHAVA